MGLLINTLVKGAMELGISITDGQAKQFDKYSCLLVEKNKNLNLTTVTEETEVAVKHFIDSLTCLKAVNFDGNKSLMDVGTGAGFPGIPLKIYREDLKVTLIESQEKKVIFLREVIAKLGLNKIEAIHTRAEDIGKNKNYREKYDLVVARAVATIGVLAEYCLPEVKLGGCFLAMKGPKIEEEIKEAMKAIEILGGEVEDTIKIRLPFIGDERRLIVIKKVKPTPAKYPRRAGMPQKRPL